MTTRVDLLQVRWRACLLAAVMGVVICPSVWGQETPAVAEALQQQQQREAEELLRQQQREEALRERLEEQPVVHLEAPRATLDRFPDREFPCFVIHELEMRGEAVDRFSWVKDAVLGSRIAGSETEGSPLGRCLGTEGINLVVKRAQNALIDRGFVTSRVLVEPQDLGTGTLVLTLIPGRIANIRWAEPAPSWASWQSALPARPGDILNLRDIEQALENFQHLPSVVVDIQIAPGDVPGESDLVIAYDQQRAIRASASLDNDGSDATGRYLSGVTLSLDNPLGLNDLAYVSLGKDVGGGDPGPRGNKSRLAHYSIPWGYWRLNLNASDYDYHQTVQGAFEEITYSGTSRNLNGSLSRLLYRDDTSRTTLSVGAFQRQSRNFIDDVEVEVQRRVVGGWQAGLSHREFIGSSILDANLNYQRGTGAFGALPAPEEAFGEGTSRFEIITASANARVPFQWGEQRLRYLGHTRLQHNLTPLGPLERFSIGSRQTVRGFTDTSLVGERGWLVRNELEAALGSSGQSLYGALDYGRVSGPATRWQLGNHLAGAALGVRGSLGDRFHYDTFIAAPLSKPDGLRTDDFDFGFSMQVTL